MTKILHKLATLYWKIFKPNTYGVRAILVQNDKVLLVRHSYDRSWFLPGGGIKRNESEEQALQRELLEEIGCTIKNKELLGTYTNQSEGKKDRIRVFASKDFKLGDTNSTEVDKSRTFRLDDLPKDISPGTKRRLDEYQKGLRNIETTW